jgi:hypothetical protein
MMPPSETSRSMSEIYEPPLTFNLYSGGVMTFYGQFSPVFQSFDDGEETTSGIVDNGNWNSRLGSMIPSPSGPVRRIRLTALAHSGSVTAMAI